MIVINFLLSLILLINSVGAMPPECKTALDTLFKTSISKKSASEFLKLQGDLTLHRLMWAYLKSQKDDQVFEIKSVEETIIELLNEKYTNSNADFIKAREEFEKQPLSRTTLSEIAPYLKELLSSNFKEEDSLFKLNLSDLKLLGSLAKFERKSAKNGKFDHRMLNTKSPLGMLNFVKLINSSYKSKLTPEEQSLEIEKKITGLENILISMEEKLSNFLNAISLPEECNDHSNCADNPNCKNGNLLSDIFEQNEEIQKIFWESLSDKLDTDDILLEKLTYGNLWPKVRESFIANSAEDKKTIHKTTPTPQMKPPSPQAAKDLGVLIEDPIRIILNDGTGRSRGEWEKHPKDFQMIMAQSIVSGDKVFEFNGYLFNRHTGKIIDLHQAISIFHPKKFKDIEELIKKIDPQLRVSLTKAIVNNHKTFIFKGKLYNTDGKVIDPASSVAEEMSRKLGISVDPERYRNMDADYIVRRANALKNNDPYFRVKDETYDSYSGRNLISPFRKPSGSDVRIEKSKSIIFQHLSDIEIIKNYHREFPNAKCKYYGILDKKNALLKIFANGGEEIYSTEALIGSRLSDARTRWTEYRSPVDKTPSYSTGAGIYTAILENPKDLYNKNKFNNNIISFNDERDNKTVFAIHQVPTGSSERYLKFGTNNPMDRRLTGGCANLKVEDLLKTKNFLGPQCRFYVLPEEPDNKFIVTDGVLKFVSTKPVQLNKMSLYNYSGLSSSPHEIDIKIANPEVNTLIAREFIRTLEVEKNKLMKIYNLSNEEYNDIALLAFGILGNESKFGKSNRLQLKENNQGLVIFWKHVFDGEDLDVARNTSRGLTQIKFLPKDILKQNYPQISKANLMEPQNAAIATMAYLAEAVRQMRQITRENKKDPTKLKITKENMMDYMNYLYQGRREALTSDDSKKQATPELNEYYRNLQKNMSYIEIRQKIE